MLNLEQKKICSMIFDRTKIFTFVLNKIELCSEQNVNLLETFLTLIPPIMNFVDTVSLYMIYHHYDRSLLLPVLTNMLKDTFNRALIVTRYGMTQW